MVHSLIRYIFLNSRILFVFVCLEGKREWGEGSRADFDESIYMYIYSLSYLFSYKSHHCLVFQPMAESSRHLKLHIFLNHVK